MFANILKIIRPFFSCANGWADYENSKGSDESVRRTQNLIKLDDASGRAMLNSESQTSMHIY
jgi:hypothetical protein